MARQRRGTLRATVEERAGHRCEYCHAPLDYCGHQFHLDHVSPESRGGSHLPKNRALACGTCNLAKSDKMRGVDPVSSLSVRLFNPRKDAWDEHFEWGSDQATLFGKTPIGRATVLALDMNRPMRLSARVLWFRVGVLP